MWRQGHHSRRAAEIPFRRRLDGPRTGALLPCPTLYCGALTLPGYRNLHGLQGSVVGADSPTREAADRWRREIGRQTAPGVAARPALPWSPRALLRGLARGG